MLSQHEVDPDSFYRVEDNNIDGLIKMSSELFDRFTDPNIRDRIALINAINTIQAAINLFGTELTFQGYHDLAFCYRRLATMVIRDNQNKKRYANAREILNMALAIHYNYPSSKEIDLLEMQRTLHQIRKIAYEFKDGNLLEQVTNDFFPLALTNPEPNYLNDCYESKFHLAFARSNFDDAFRILNEAKDVKEGSTRTWACHEIKTHLAKLQMLDLTDKKSYFEQHIEKPFWDDEYDKRKEKVVACNTNLNKINKVVASNPDSKKINERMAKELILLFSIRCQRWLLGMNWGKPPLAYVLQHAKEIFGSIDNPYYVKLRGTLRGKVQAIRENHFLALDYTFFENTTPPGIRIDEQYIAKMLPPLQEKKPGFFDEKNNNLPRNNETDARAKLDF